MVGGREKETPSTSPILSMSLEQPRTDAVITPKHYVSPEPTHPANFITVKPYPLGLSPVALVRGPEACPCLILVGTHSYKVIGVCPLPFNFSAELLSWG